jgi:hypothetical protein
VDNSWHTYKAAGGDHDPGPGCGRRSGGAADGGIVATGCTHRRYVNLAPNRHLSGAGQIVCRWSGEPNPARTAQTSRGKPDTSMRRQNTPHLRNAALGTGSRDAATDRPGKPVARPTGSMAALSHGDGRRSHRPTVVGIGDLLGSSIAWLGAVVVSGRVSPAASPSPPRPLRETTPARAPAPAEDRPSWPRRERGAPISSGPWKFSS